MPLVSVPDQSWVVDLGEIAGVDLRVWDPRHDDTSEAGRAGMGIEVYVAPYLQGLEPIRRAVERPSVRLVQLLTAGFDGVLEIVPEGVQVANAGPVHDDSTAELALALTLAAQRGIPEAVLGAQRGEWLHLGGRPSLADRRCVVIGYGGVGRGITRRLLAFGAQVSAVASRPRAGDDLVEQIRGVDDLPDLLPDTEIALLALPLTPATRGLVGHEFLARMPPAALVVNVARGPVIDTSALLAHVGRIRFALDVTDPEPLPPDHPLWSAPGVLITPHIGGPTTAFRPRAVAMLREQLARLGRGEDPAYLVG